MNRRSFAALAAFLLPSMPRARFRQPSPGRSLGDLTALPRAEGQPALEAAYRALAVLRRRAGESYNDPLTGVRVWKATSDVVPEANTGAGHDYADAGWQVSQSWGAGPSWTILVRGDGMGYWLVDFDRASGFRSWRRFPTGSGPARDLGFSFSANPATPRHAYVNVGDHVIRLNTASMRVENVPPWPFRSAPGSWLHQDRNDEWFVKLEGARTVVAWNARNGRTLRHTWALLNEPRLERDGRLVALVGEGKETVRFWDLMTDTTTPALGRYPFAHNASMRGHWVATNWDLSAPWAVNRVMPDGKAVQVLAPAFGTGVHHSGSWVQSDAELGGDLLKQWSIASTYATPNPQVRLQNAIGFMRSDGSDARLLCHTYQVGGNYWSIPFATSSPDGRLVIFNSNMLTEAGRYDLFVAEVPA